MNLSLQACFALLLVVSNEDAIDSDGDGVSDAVEIAQGTDPEVKGLFPGAVPHIPEPLVFDLVRALGAERGELEANVLAIVDADDGQVDWAPEIEWAFLEGLAFELEVPIVDLEVEALKLALQGTLPESGENFAHGLQGFVELAVDERATDVVTVYIWGQRFAERFTYLAMVGAEQKFRERDFQRAVGVLNASVFVDVREWQTWGVETNIELTSSDRWLVRSTPQVHLQLLSHFGLQLSVGLEADPEGARPIFAARAIVD